MHAALPSVLALAVRGLSTGSGDDVSLDQTKALAEVTVSVSRREKKNEHSAKISPDLLCHSLPVKQQRQQLSSHSSGKSHIRPEAEEAILSSSSSSSSSPLLLLLLLLFR